ncbi:MAG: hypothetical protein ACRD3I_06570 [Terriglobales bacterium]
MQKRPWLSFVAVILLLSALPVTCHAGEQMAAPATTASANISLPSGNANESDCTCHEDCFCCTLIVPIAFFELSYTLACESVSIPRDSGNPLDRTTEIYHPPRS